MSDKPLQLRKPVSVMHSPSGEDVEEMILRGGSSPAIGLRRSPSPQIRKSVIVYFDPAELARIDRLRRSMRVKTSRQRWLMEAILKELDRCTPDPS